MLHRLALGFCLLAASAPCAAARASHSTVATATAVVAPAGDLAAFDTPNASEKYLVAAKARVLAECQKRKITLPKDFLAWIDSDRDLRASVYGCRANPLAVVLGLRSLEIDLGEHTVRKDYTQLGLAIAIQQSYRPAKRKAGGWNDGDDDIDLSTLPDVSPRPALVLTIPNDPRAQVDTKDPKRTLDRDDHIINFLEDHTPIEVTVTSKELPPLEYDDQGVAKPRGKKVEVTTSKTRPLIAADVISSASLQREFNEYMAAHGQDVRIDCGDGAVKWGSTEAVEDGALRKNIATAHDLFQAAYRAKGRMPVERDAAPSASESMAWFIRNDRYTLPKDARGERKWPRFPLKAPWPVLIMLAADDQPLREREEIWTKFVDTGEAATYGEYIGGIAQQFDMQSARRSSPFAFSYGSIQMMWKDGGVCGTMGNIGARTLRILGVPASTAGQPGHCAMVQMNLAKANDIECIGGQYATGGDEVTTVHAGWNYDDRGGRRPMIFHQTVAWGTDAGADSFVDTLVMRRVWDAMAPEQRAKRSRAFLRDGLTKNPYAMVVVEAAIEAAPDAEVAMELYDDFLKQIEQAGVPATRTLYRDTVRDLAHARVLALPSPPSREGANALLEQLVSQKCANAVLLARCWRDASGEEGFLDGCVKAAEAYLASPDRTKNKKASEKFTAQVKTWAKTVKGKQAKAAWAASVLKAFDGKDTLTIKSKAQPDPAATELRKLVSAAAPKPNS